MKYFVPRWFVPTRGKVKAVIICSYFKPGRYQHEIRKMFSGSSMSKRSIKRQLARLKRNLK